MRVFFSCTGERSRKVATAMRDWLPSVLPNVSVFLSSESIEKGARWNEVLSKELETCSFGILFVTKENQDSKWLAYEAGALSKAVDGSRVIPLLLNLSAGELTFPLAQFQSATATVEGIEGVLQSISSREYDSDAHVRDADLRKRVRVWWPYIKRVFREAAGDNVLARGSDRTVLRPRTPWMTKLLATDPQNACYAVGDAVVFDQSSFGTGYNAENIYISYSGAPYQLPQALQSIADAHRGAQIGRNLPHYVITSFKHSETDYPDVMLSLARCWYMDIRSLQAALQQDPGQLTGADRVPLIDRLLSMGPLDLNRDPLPSQLSVNVAVILAPPGNDPSLLIVQRGPKTQVGYYPEAWSVSIQETMSAGSGVHADGAQDSDTSLQRCAVRGVREELLGTEPADMSVELHSFFVEAPLLNQSVMAIARVRLAFDQVCQRRRCLAPDSRENALVCAVPCRPESLLRLLNATELDLDYVRGVGKIDHQASPASVATSRTWHPSSKLAVLSVLRRYFPEQARRWLLAQADAGDAHE